METLLILLIMLALVGTAGWYITPMMIDSLKLRRENDRIINITKQTKRDMDNLARKQRKNDGW